ncbi:hypothetical protein GCM10028812_53140 [Ancylobacter sonchi]
MEAVGPPTILCLAETATSEQARNRARRPFTALGCPLVGGAADLELAEHCTEWVRLKGDDPKGGQLERPSKNRRPHDKGISPAVRTSHLHPLTPG